MLPGHRSLLLVALSLLSGCGSSNYTSISGSLDAPSSGSSTPGSGSSGNGSVGDGAITGTFDSVVATPSIAGTVFVAAGKSQTQSVTFASSDGLAITGFAISGTTLAPDWSGPDDFSCLSVSTGSGCVLTLTYAPTSVGSGTLTLNYIYVDNANLPRAPGGSLTIAYAATTPNNAIATASPTGQINAAVGADSRSVSVNFTTDDGNAATNLALITSLAALPSGWSSMATNLACAIVSTGSGCQLPLTYAPTAAGRGTLTLNYGYTDDSGAARIGAVNIPYSTASHDTIVGTASPTGQIIAIEKTGGQAVDVTFNTDDGKPATALYLTSELTALPPGWNSAASSFSCGEVGAGNGCQLHLTYAPTVLTSGTLTLNYAYTDDAGTAQTGSLNVANAATTDDNVVGTPSPTGQIYAKDLDSQPVSVTFTTDDGRPATALQLTSNLATLPAGWSSTDSTFTCSGLSSGTGCQLPLMYAPTAAGSGTLTLGYAYKNNAGESKTGSLNIPYRATTNDSVVWTQNPNPLAVLAGSTTSVNVIFNTNDGNLSTGLSVTSDLSALPTGWSSTSGSFACSNVSAGSACRLSLTYTAPAAAAAGTLILAYGYYDDSGTPKSGYVSIPYTATP